MNSWPGCSVGAVRRMCVAWAARFVGIVSRCGSDGLSARSSMRVMTSSSSAVSIWADALGFSSLTLPITCWVGTRRGVRILRPGCAHEPNHAPGPGATTLHTPSQQRQSWPPCPPIQPSKTPGPTPAKPTKPPAPSPAGATQFTGTNSTTPPPTTTPGTNPSNTKCPITQIFVVRYSLILSLLYFHCLEERFHGS